MKVALLGNYLPRPCGIATFTANLTTSILNAQQKETAPNEVFVVAMNDGVQDYDYPEIVKHTISQQEQSQYLDAAKFINNSEADICIVQHEFGIFGGESGVFVLGLLHELKMPIVTTVHTVLRTPSYHEKNILKKIGELSQKMIVMSNLAVEFLASIYSIPNQKISVIQHGVPDFSAIQHERSKLLSHPGKKVLGTFGFLGRSKGIETVINALPALIKVHPDVIYVVVGQTHPNVKKHSGEEYRDYLKNLAIDNGVEKNVVFEDGFFKEEDLKSFLMGLDLYITPYLNEAQITSGTISYAIGAGACIVSTPFWHAKELLADGRGRTFGFSDSIDLSNTLCALLDNPSEIEAMKSKAFAYGKEMYWNKIGEAHHELLQKVIHSTKVHLHKNKATTTVLLPPFSMNHIKRLTDDMGILEHANYSVPDYKEGYCLDDNVRALLLVLMANKLEVDKDSVALADTYLRYIKLMQKEDGFFHNDMSYEKTFLDEVGSEDSFGRTIWAIGYLIRLAPNDSHFQFAKDIFFKSLPNFETIKSIRAIASIILGLGHFLKRYPDNENVMHLLQVLTSKLKQQHHDESSSEWNWFEPILSYDNAMLPLSLWESYRITQDKKTYELALVSTSFLFKKTFVNNRFSLVGNTWLTKGEDRPSDGQQPIDAMAMVMLFSKAFAVTKETSYREKMHKAFSWFLGDNDLHIPLYDDESKGCCDGLGLHSINRNQGAESTISYLLSYLTIWQTEMESTDLNNFFGDTSNNRDQIIDNQIITRSKMI
ncbi:glycosyltransferase family 4 protein [Maribacter sp.]|nr:glycosyltransferase family 4 protein [Maribacter sp.]